MPASTDRASRADTMVFIAVLLVVRGWLLLVWGLLGLAVELLVEALGVESGAGGSCDAGKHRQGEQGGYDHLHGYSPRGSRIGLCCSGLLGLAVELLVKALGIEGGASGSCDAGEYRQGEQSGY